MMMMRSTKKDFDQNSALQAACDISIARACYGGGYRSVTPLLMPGYILQQQLLLQEA